MFYLLTLNQCELRVCKLLCLSGLQVRLSCVLRYILQIKYNISFKNYETFISTGLNLFRSHYSRKLHDGSESPNRSECKQEKNFLHRFHTAFISCLCEHYRAGDLINSSSPQATPLTCSTYFKHNFSHPGNSGVYFLSGQVIESSWGGTLADDV